MDSINNACKFGSDAWLELQAFKTRQLNRREKLNRHKNLHKDLINGITFNQNHHQFPPNIPSSLSSVVNNSTSTNHPGPSRTQQLISPHNNHQKLSTEFNIDLLNGTDGSYSNNDTDLIRNSNSTINSKSTSNDSPPIVIDYSVTAIASDSDRNHLNLELVECLLLLKLCDVALKLPIDSSSLQRSIGKIRGLESTPQSLIENLLQKFAHQELITVEELTTNLLSRQKRKQITGSSSADGDKNNDESCIYVTSADHTKLVEFDKSFGSLDNIRGLLIESKLDDQGVEENDLSFINQYCSVPIQTVRNSSNLTNSLSDSNHRNDNSCKVNSDNCAKQEQDNNDSTELHRLNSSMVLHKFSTNHNNIKKQQAGDDLESLLSLSSTRERESKKLGEELLELLSKPTAKERNLLERFRSADGYQVQEFCPKGTKGECSRNNKGAAACEKLHFKKIIAKHTEESLGDCSFLNTCFHMDSCKYVHYEVDYDEKQPQQHQFKRPHPAEPLSKQRRNIKLNHTIDHPSLSEPSLTAPASKSDNNNNKPTGSISLPRSACAVSKYTLSPEEQARIDAKNRKRFKTVLYPPQWIQCDLRFFDMSLLGKFSVIMADPPWDIHMELPYGTMSDDEMRKLNIPALQDEGVIFLWVTGRAMELGRECLALWGYERCDEIIWVKTNQLQRIIRTGRTGHWLNHGKEHCLVGVKGNPKDINRGLDCDVIVAEVRATSHKPDEIYGIIERLSPGTRKIELFGRAHNVQPNWITLGNQLNGVKLIEPSLVNAFKKLNLPFQTADHAT